MSDRFSEEIEASLSFPYFSRSFLPFSPLLLRLLPPLRRPPPYLHLPCFLSTRLHTDDAWQQAERIQREPFNPLRTLVNVL